MKRLALFLLAVAVLAGGGYYWKVVRPSASSPAAAPAAKGGGAVPVRVATVRVGAISDEISAVGTLIANESVMIRPERDGRITEIRFSEGQLVRKGDRLVALDTAEIEAQLAAASSELTLNRSRLNRAEELHAKKFISAQALDDAREALNQSAARRAEVKARVDKSTVIAPFEGVAGLRQVSPGAYVKAGQDIARLEGIGTLKLDFRVPELYMGRMRPKQEVVLRVDAYPGESFRGEIYAIEPAVEESSRTVLLRARVSNPGARLKPGMFARVALVLETRDNAIIIPEQALVLEGKDRYVYRYLDGKAVLERVELGLRRPGEVEVRQGLSAGQAIVVDGQLRLRDGAPVTVLADQRDQGPGTADSRAKSPPKAVTN